MNNQDSILQTAVELLGLGFKVILTDEHKNPGIPGVGVNWPTFKWTASKFASFLDKRPNLQLGLLLGDFVDVEIDAPDETYRQDAEREFKGLAGDSETMSWTSRRGVHRLYAITKEQKELLIARKAGAVVKVGKLEMRLGIEKAAQSLIPPSETDGFKRQWLSIVKPVPIPDQMFDAILDNIKVKHESSDGDDDASGPSRPGDIFNERATWDEILEPFGWRRTKGVLGNGVVHWTRPGKSEGVSATTGYCETDSRPDCFYSFSDAPEIEPLESKKTYSKFEAFCILNFDGDFSAATADVIKQGYVEEFDGSEFESIFVTDSEPPEPPRKDPGSDNPDFIFDNPIGRYVLANDPHTESDKMGVLMQSWELFGTWIGKSAKFAMNNVVHYANDFLLVVGETADARKGTSLTDAMAPYELGIGDLPDFRERCILKGLSSGEGLIKFADDRNERPDGRVMIIAEEFARVITGIRRTESTLSSVLREAYDGKTLAVQTKADPLKASKAHVSVIAHTTSAEFHHRVAADDFFNGLLNRFLFVHVKRGKRLPWPTTVDPSVLEDLGRELNKAREWVDNEGIGRVFYWSEDARQMWADFYCGSTDEDRHSVARRDEAESAIVRGPTHVIRMAMRHAALDREEAISRRHLESAIALWNVSRRSLRLVMCDRVSDDAEKVLTSIQDAGGLSKTEIHKIFNGHKSSAEVTSILDFLVENDFVKVGNMKKGKRKVKVWAAL